MPNKVWELEMMLERGIDSQVLGAECLKLLNSPNIEEELLKENVSDDDSFNENVVEIKQWLRLNGFDQDDNAVAYVIQLCLFQTLLKCKNDQNTTLILTESWLENKRQNLQDKFEVIYQSFKQKKGLLLTVADALHNYIQSYWWSLPFLFYSPQITNYFCGNEDSWCHDFSGGSWEACGAYQTAIGMGILLLMSAPGAIRRDDYNGFFKSQKHYAAPYLYPPTSNIDETKSLTFKLGAGR